LPIAFHLTGGEASDSRNFETLLDIGPDLNPRALGRWAMCWRRNRCRLRLTRTNSGLLSMLPSSRPRP
jgi:hypothetical protein